MSLGMRQPVMQAGGCGASASLGASNAVLWALQVQRTISSFVFALLLVLPPVCQLPATACLSPADRVWCDTVCCAADKKACVNNVCQDCAGDGDCGSGKCCNGKCITLGTGDFGTVCCSADKETNCKTGLACTSSTDPNTCVCAPGAPIQLMPPAASTCWTHSRQ